MPRITRAPARTHTRAYAHAHAHRRAKVWHTRHRKDVCAGQARKPCASIFLYAPSSHVRALRVCHRFRNPWHKEWHTAVFITSSSAVRVIVGSRRVRCAPRRSVGDASVASEGPRPLTSPPRAAWASYRALCGRAGGRRMRSVCRGRTRRGCVAAHGRPGRVCHGMCHRLEILWHSVAQALVQVSEVFHKRVDVIYLKVCHIIYSV